MNEKMDLVKARSVAAQLNRDAGKHESPLEVIASGPRKDRVLLVGGIMGGLVVLGFVVSLGVSQLQSNGNVGEAVVEKRDTVEVVPTFERPKDPPLPTPVVLRKPTSYVSDLKPTEMRPTSSQAPTVFRAAKYTPPVLSAEPNIPGPTIDAEAEAAKRAGLFVPLSGAVTTGQSQAIPAQYTPSGGSGGGATSLEDLMSSSGASRQKPADPLRDFYNQKGSGVTVQMISENTVAQGTLIPGVLLSDINSDLPGPILAYVTANVYDTLTGKHILIPQGSRLIAQYNSVIGWGQERIQIGWSRVQRPDGVVINLGNMAGVDMAGTAGVAAQVDGHPWDYLLALGFMMGTQISLAELKNSTQLAPTPGLQNLGQLAQDTVGPPVNQLGTTYLNKQMQRPATLRIPKGIEMGIFVMEDINVPSYKGGVAK